MRCQIREHVKVMSDSLGRPLLPGEEVHHRNGIKTDNNLENLEFWLSSQPKGQRVEDLLEWAHEIIDRYEGSFCARSRVAGLSSLATEED